MGAHVNEHTFACTHTYKPSDLVYVNDCQYVSRYSHGHTMAAMAVG
jgi:hypothetical protein